MIFSSIRFQRVVRGYARLALVALSCLFSAVGSAESIQGLAELRANDLRLSTYFTSDRANTLAADESARAESVAILHDLGVSKVYIEVYRGGVEVGEESLTALRDYYQGEGFQTAGAIATVAGGDFGVADDTGKYWLNFQAQKTQDDLARVIREAARVFDTLIVDDFFCTSDESAVSKQAKGGRGWGEYRRALMTEVAQKSVIGPAREENPDIHLILKYPQWYDRFESFGYDTATLPGLFDEIWVGTESRGAYTPRFGYTQPYEGFVNYRWLAGIAGDKIGGAWFDHADCDANDFIDQAWQSVLAGANELVLFEYSVLQQGHPGHALLKRDFEALADLAALVDEHPVTGIPAYKPVNSSPGANIYAMDFLGMLGIPLVPTHLWPATTKGTIFLPDQALADPSATGRAISHIDGGGSIVMSLGFVAANAELAAKAGLAGPAEVHPMSTGVVMAGSEPRAVSPMLRLAGRMTPGEAESVLTAQVEGEDVPYLTLLRRGEQHIWVINLHTFSQEDFDKNGEMLLSPEPIALLDLEQEWVDVIRYAFTQDLPVRMSAPGRVTLQPLGDTGCYVQNYRQESADLHLMLSNGDHEATVYSPDGNGGFDAETIRGKKLKFTMPPRSSVWVKRLGR
ncbi:MAG: hypothetical protein GC168_11560 [Candidatus Hydrogenedens sp.]|nr:hypothetical protein [Candidatus Hydrogenedens sp.]